MRGCTFEYKSVRGYDFPTLPNRSQHHTNIKWTNRTTYARDRREVGAFSTHVCEETGLKVEGEQWTSKHWRLRNSTFGKDEGYRQIIKNPLNNFNQLNLIPKPHHSTLEAMSGHKENGKIKNSSTCEIANKPMSSKSTSYCSSCGTIRDQSLKFTSFHETTKKRIRATRGRYIQFSTSSGNKKLCPLGTDALVWSDVYWNAWQIEMLLVWGGCISLGHAETKARPLTGAVFNHPSSNTSDVNLLPESDLCEVLIHSLYCTHITFRRGSCHLRHKWPLKEWAEFDLASTTLL